MASRHPSQRFYYKQVAEQYQYGTKIFAGQKEQGREQNTSLVEAFVHGDSVAVGLSAVFSHKGLRTSNPVHLFKEKCPLRKHSEGDSLPPSVVLE